MFFSSIGYAVSFWMKVRDCFSSFSVVFLPSLGKWQPGVRDKLYTARDLSVAFSQTSCKEIVVCLQVTLAQVKFRLELPARSSGLTADKQIPRFIRYTYAAQDSPIYRTVKMWRSESISRYRADWLHHRNPREQARLVPCCPGNTYTIIRVFSSGRFQLLPDQPCFITKTWILPSPIAISASSEKYIYLSTIS